MIEAIYTFGDELFGMFWPLIWAVIKIMVLLLPVLTAVSYLTWAERKIIGWMQIRCGPNRVGPFGLLQPLADAVKLFFKETILPTTANKGVFILAPMITLVTALAAWATVPFTETLVVTNLNIGVLYILAMSSIGVYGIIMAGWASNSRWAFLGGMRSAAQMVSYEICMGFAIVPVVLLSGSLNLVDIVKAQENVWFVVPLFPVFVIFFIAIVAETNRSPFDLPEAEAELVAGYNTDYSAMTFALFFLGEYSSMIMLSTLCSILFLGGWLPPLELLSFIPGIVWLILKTGFILFVFLWIRATFPRYRYDQLMRLGWKVFLPMTLFWIFVTGTGMYIFGVV